MTLPSASPVRPGERFAAVDALRGLVVVLMIIDHVREYSIATVKVTDPMPLDELPLLLFWMRWVTHFCAPVFTFLAGLSAGLQAGSVRASDTAPAWSWHLVTRGLVLVLLEVTVVHVAWTFSFVWPMHYLQVIWGIGLSLITLGLLQRVPVPVRVALGAVCIAGHNALDALHVSSPAALQWLWAILHDRQVLSLWGEYTVRTSYPVLPMIGLVLVGDGVGRWYRGAAEPSRVRLLRAAGLACLVCFALLRSANVYGDLHPAVYGPDWGRNIRSALNVTKYPMSLDFVLMTLGPALLLLGAWERRRPAWTDPLVRLGQVPMFLYITHLYLLHAGAIVVALLAGIPWAMFDFRKTITGLPPGVGFTPGWTVPITALLVVVLYPAAGWYAQLRASKRYGFTRYL